MQKKTSVFSNGLIWFGAAVSIAEILTGTLLASLGFRQGLAAIVIGHIIGCVPLYAAGLIGAREQKSAMETVKISFGQKGGAVFSALNILQLIGWSAVMTASGAAAADAVASLNIPLWCVIIGALIIVWVLIGLKNLSAVNTVAMGALFILSLVLSSAVFSGGAAAQISDVITFGAAVELVAAMPLSWLPLISDYTMHAQKPRAASAVSVAVYFIVSSWMNAIGLGAALFTGESDIAQIMVKASMGAAALIIVIFSTVTTTFLDVYSAGVSFESISKKVSAKALAVAVTVIGVLIAVFVPEAGYMDFLYLIGSVFAPMTAILICDYFIMKRDFTVKNVNAKNFCIWAVGVVIYRVFMRIDTPLGNTLPVMAIVIILSILFGGKKNDI